jgi:hypothetical protein
MFTFVLLVCTVFFYQLARTEITLGIAHRSFVVTNLEKQKISVIVEHPFAPYQSKIVMIDTETIILAVLSYEIL